MSDFANRAPVPNFQMSLIALSKLAYDTKLESHQFHCLMNHPWEKKDDVSNDMNWAPFKYDT